jgi:hypothetical protein
VRDNNDRIQINPGRKERKKERKSEEKKERKRDGSNAVVLYRDFST